jgi:Flp pilus assembly protein TadG
MRIVCCRQRTAARRASVTALAAVCLIVIFGFVALAVDGGRLLNERRRAQTVADAAALAVAADLYQNWSKNKGLDPNGTAKASALSVASANGYTNDGTTSTVTVNIPPTSGDHVGTAGYAEVVVQYNTSRTFSAIYGSGSLPVKARSVARGLKKSPPPALHVLNASANKALEFDKADGYVDVSGQTICVNSAHSVAAHWNGGSSDNGHILAQEVDINGGSNHTDYFATAPTAGNVITGSPAVADSLASLPAPDAAALTNQYAVAPTGTVTIDPGVYTGGLTIAGSSTNVTMNPGIYYMQAGKFSQSDGNVTGTGVFIYSEGLDTVMDISGGTCNLSAPTSGTYSGILLFGSRSTTKPVNWSGSKASVLNGTIYAPGSAVNYSGAGNITVGGRLVSDTFWISGAGTLTVKGVATSTRDVRLVE